MRSVNTSVSMMSTAGKRSELPTRLRRLVFDERLAYEENIASAIRPSMH
jgi:hypothetical protein